MKLLIVAPPDAHYLRLLEPLKPAVDLVATNDPAQLKTHIAEARVIVNSIGATQLLRDAWPHARKVEWVHSLSAGVETVIFPELQDSPVPLTNARGVYKESLGEFAITAALYFAKDVPRMLRAQREQRWDPFDVDVLYRQSMGIVGYGEIGRAAAVRAKAMGLTVYATRRRPELSAHDPLIDESFPLDQRADMMSRSDYVLVSTPLTDDTRGLIGAPELAAMKPTGVIINVGRGPVIDEAALVDTLANRRIKGAALDVFDTEPLPQGHPFWSMDNVLLSPHCADHEEGWQELTVKFFLTNFERFRKGEPLLNIVDKKAGY